MRLTRMNTAALLLVFCLLGRVAVSCSADPGIQTKITETGAQKAEQWRAMRVNVNSSVLEVINNPAFAGYGRFIFPTERGLPDAGLTLGKINPLLPYHSNINTDTTVAVVNYMLETASNDAAFFYDIYTEEEKMANPAKRDTGLFFFRGEPGAPFAVVSAGGGFSYVGSIHESFPHALELSKRGYNAFVLQYRTGGANVACEDLAAAISFIFAHAEELETGTNDYSLWGGSAGARMAAYLGSYGTSYFGGNELPRPAAVVIQYTGHTDYTKNDPPTYACVGENDGIANWRTMESRINNLSRLGITTEFHKYPNVGHGFGLGVATPAEGWLDDAVAFWKKQISR